MDPLANNAISEIHGDISGKLLTQCKIIYETKPNNAPLIIEIDEQTRAQLKELRYVDIPGSLPDKVVDSETNGSADKSNATLDFGPIEEIESNENLINNAKSNEISTASNKQGDEDGVGNLCDNYSRNYNPHQEDSDKDGVGDECDNCLDKPNGPKRGTCIGDINNGYHSPDDTFCRSKGFCSLDQEDLDGDD